MRNREGEIPDEKVPIGRSAGRGGGHYSYDAASDSMKGVPCLSSFLHRHFPDLLQGGVQIRIKDTL